MPIPFALLSLSAIVGVPSVGSRLGLVLAIDESTATIKKRFGGISRLSFDMPVRSDHDRGTLKEIVQDLKRS